MKLAAVGDNCMDVYENIGKAYPGGNPVNVAVYFVRLGGESPTREWPEPTSTEN